MLGLDSYSISSNALLRSIRYFLQDKESIEAI